MNDSGRFTVRLPLASLAALVILLAPVTVAAHGKGGGKALQLEVNEAEDALITRQASKCMDHASRPDMPEKCCFRFAKGKWDTVRFKLKRKTPI